MPNFTMRALCAAGSLLLAGTPIDTALAQGMPSPQAQAQLAAPGNGSGVPFLVSAADLAAKQGVAQDSWFVISHLKAGDRTLDLMVHYIRLTPPKGEPFVQAIVSLLDSATGKYLSDEKIYPVSASRFASDKLDVQTPSGTMSGSADAVRVTGKFDRLSLDLQLAPKGPLLANLGTGLLPFFGDINYEYAMPNMATRGTVTLDGKSASVTGQSWLDRQWGNMAPSFWAQRKWSWMGITLDNGSYISLWDIVFQSKSNAFATLLHPDGRHEIVAVEPLAKTAENAWKSSTGHRYPTHWTIKVPQLSGTLVVVPKLREQEIVSPMGVHKYEGASAVSGTLLGKRVKGRAVVEMVGDWVD